MLFRLLVSRLADRILRRRIVQLLETIARRSHTIWDDSLLTPGVLVRAGFLIPLGLLWWLAPEAR